MSRVDRRKALGLGSGATPPIATEQRFVGWAAVLLGAVMMLAGAAAMLMTGL